MDFSNLGETHVFRRSERICSAPMDLLRQALKEQYHAGLAMLAECIERCPDDLWLSGEPGRQVWRIAFHTVFFTQAYLGQDVAAYQTWPGHREDCRRALAPADMEPYELPEETEPVAREAMLRYLVYVDGLVDPTIEALDLDAEETGFSWYKGMSKLSHEIMNLRHIQGHVGQLSELLMARGIDIEWVGKAGHLPR